LRRYQAIFSVAMAIPMSTDVRHASETALYFLLFAVLVLCLLGVGAAIAHMLT